MSGGRAVRYLVYRALRLTLQTRGVEGGALPAAAALVAIVFLFNFFALARVVQWVLEFRASEIELLVCVFGFLAGCGVAIHRSVLRGDRWKQLLTEFDREGRLKRRVRLALMWCYLAASVVAWVWSTGLPKGE
jgi:hypothetical protein